jgi:hypothetical protein
MNYRFLNLGEIIQGGDLYLTEEGMSPARHVIGLKIDETSLNYFMRAAPIESTWIAITERKPTREDGIQIDLHDYEFYVLARRDIGGGVGQILLRAIDDVMEFSHLYTHWMPIPHLPKAREPQPYDGFDDWFKSLPGNSLFHEETLRRMAYVAGREYEKAHR